jgi:hypothetical protein
MQNVEAFTNDNPARRQPVPGWRKTDGPTRSVARLVEARIGPKIDSSRAKAVRIGSPSRSLAPPR